MAPVHVVSDGDQAIAAGLQTVYGQEVPHQLCHFHLLREYRRNLGWDGWAEARGLLASESVAEGQHWARRVEAPVSWHGVGFDRWTGAVLVSESLAARATAFGNGTDGFQDHVAAGTAEPRVPATGKDGHGMDAAQPRIKCGAGFIDTAPKARPDQPNHLICNATGVAPTTPAATMLRRRDDQNRGLRAPYQVRGDVILGLAGLGGSTSSP